MEGALTSSFAPGRRGFSKVSTLILHPRLEAPVFREAPNILTSINTDNLSNNCFIEEPQEYFQNAYFIQHTIKEKDAPL